MYPKDQAAWSIGEIVVYNGEYMEGDILFCHGKSPFRGIFTDAALIGVDMKEEVDSGSGCIYNGKRFDST